MFLVTIFSVTNRKNKLNSFYLMQINLVQKRAFIFLLLFFYFGCKERTSPVHPHWVEDAIFYQIFPERFSNGDPSNDPTKESLKGSWPHDAESAWQVSPWTSDWYKLQPWEEQNGKGFDHNVQRRRYGGDIQGIINKLDYLSELGINTIYINPIFHSPSLHKYDAATYHHVDAYFGPNPQNDLEIMENEDPVNPQNWQWTEADKLFLELIKQAHEKNIRIILDGVFNHTGINFWAFKDIQEKGQQSKFKDWFVVNAWDDPATEQNEFDYAGWTGVKELPELKEDEKGLVAPVRDYVFASIKRWMDPNNDGNPEDGIDGWRLDVAEMVNHNFWKKFRVHVKTINPQAYITGEIFWEDWDNNKYMDPKPWLKGDEFDGVMNYRWAVAMSDFFINKEKKISAGKFADRLYDLDLSYAKETRYQLLNLMDSHDTDRLSSHIVNPDLFFDKMVTLHDNPGYDVRKPNAHEWQILKLIVTVQMTMPGAPMVYYGSEAGMWGADDPSERKPMIWPEFVYEPEFANISTTPRPVDPVFFDSTLFNFYQSIIKIRNEQSALRSGTFRFVYSDNPSDQLIYLREKEGEQIMVVINNAAKATEIVYPIQKSSWVDLLNGSVFSTTDKFLHVPIAEKTALILKRKKN